MSLSSTHSQEPAGLEHIAVNPVRPVPALEKQQAEAEPAAEATEPAADAPQDTEPQEAEATPQEEQQPEESTQKPKAKWLGLLLDTSLVCLVVGVLAGGGYYVKTQWDQYRVPTALEMVNQQCLELCAQREQLQDAYNHADEQLLMRRRVADFDNRLRQFSEQAAQLSASIAEQKKMVLALQHEIRRADREARGATRGMLPGLQVGDVSTTRGKVYNNATISRIEGNRISLRTPYGAATVPVRELVKDNLPDMVLYALGIIDLVDMSDFTTTGEAPNSPQPKNNKLRTEVKPLRSADYEPRSAGAVLDTNANRSSTPTLPTSPRPAGDVWQAPEGDLPL